MNTRFILFLVIVAVIVTALVVFEQNRDNPWDSDVFFGQAPEVSHVSRFTG